MAPFGVEPQNIEEDNQDTRGHWVWTNFVDNKNKSETFIELKRFGSYQQLLLLIFQS